MRVALVGAELEDNLAVRYLWGALARAGHDVAHVVFNRAEDLERAAAALAASGAEVAGFSMVFTRRAREFAALAARARELGFRGHVIAGGHFAAFHAEDLLRDVPAFDSIGVGEGEAIITRLCDDLPALGAVPGLVWRDGGRVVRNPPACKPADLDTLARPPRKQPGDRYLGIGIADLLGSRGCTHACAFCSIAAWHKMTGGERLRLRAPDAIADEMAELHARGVGIFNFHDDNFFLGDAAATRARVEELVAGLARRGVGRIAFAVKCRPDSVDEELLAYLRSVGLFRVFLGIEAGTEASLRRLGRGQALSDNERALAVMNRLDLHACFNLLLLDPDSTLEDLAAHVDFLRAHPHNPMNFCRTEVYAGTPLERKLRRAGRLEGDYWGWTYRIADPRAQAAYEAIRPAFRARNFGDHALHHLAMKVDFEHQLLGHFFEPRRELRRRVKDLIVAINRDTCDHLERVIAAARAGAADAALAEAVRRDVVAADARLGDDARALLREIRRAAVARPPARRWLRGAAASASLAASMALGCGPSPRPVERPPQNEVQPGEVGDATGDPEALRPYLDLYLPSIEAWLTPDRDNVLELWIDDAGEVRRVHLVDPTVADADAGIADALASARFAAADLVGRHFVVTITPDEVHRAVDTTYESEMAPSF